MANQSTIRTFMNGRSRSLVVYGVVALVLVSAAIGGIILAKNRSSQLSVASTHPTEVAKAPSTSTQKTDTKGSTNNGGSTAKPTPTPKPTPETTKPAPTTVTPPSVAPRTGPSESPTAVVPSTGPNDLNIVMSVIGIMTTSLAGIMFIKSRRQLRSSVLSPLYNRSVTDYSRE